MITIRFTTQQTPSPPPLSSAAAIVPASTRPAVWLAVTAVLAVCAAAIGSTIAIAASDRTMTEVAPAAITSEQVTA